MKTVDIANAITELRTGSGMTQQTLAERLYVSRDLVSKWENGTRRPSYTMIEKIAAVFGVSPDSIADRSDIVFEELSVCVPEGMDISEEYLTAAAESFLRNVGKDKADMFILRYYYMKSTSEIAAFSHVGENHVRSVLSRLRKKLKKHIKESAKSDPL